MCIFSLRVYMWKEYYINTLGRIQGGIMCIFSLSLYTWKEYYINPWGVPRGGGACVSLVYKGVYMERVLH